MKLAFLTAMATVALIFSPTAQAATTIGEMAPNFTASNSNGETISLSDFKGKTVVLEWTNHECPYVIKHYSSGNMQKLQKEATEKNVIWLSIHSSAKGKQGHVNGKQANANAKEQGAHATHQILDETGTIGKLYDAKTTPHMFVINAEGTLVYAGAIDSDSSFKDGAIEKATNYVMDAIDALAAGEEIEVSSTKPYGCGIKY